MTLTEIANTIDAATAVLKADNDRAALLATCPAAWLDISAMTDRKIAAMREIDAMALKLRDEQDARDAGPNY